MRWVYWLIIFIIAAISILFSALNATMVRIDLYFVHQLIPLGVLVLLSVLLGCLMAGLVLYFTVILPLRRRLKRSNSSALKSADDSVNA